MERVNKTIIIVGPTASGKSDLAIKLAKKFKGEIISADSRQIYKGLDIGAGKVSEKEQQQVHHYMLNIASLETRFTADDFKKQGQKALGKISNRHKIPIIAGGTGFYIDILLDRMQTADVPPDLKLRKRLDRLSPEKLFGLLLELDPNRAKTIDRRNSRRLIRAIEIARTGKKTRPEKKPKIQNYQILWLGLNPKNIEEKIKQRLDKRLKQGLVEEVKKLAASFGHKRMEELGLEYRYVNRWLKSLNAKHQALNGFEKSIFYEKLLQEIRKYSKRQMTWFRKNKEINWLDPNKFEKAQEQAEKLVERFFN